LQFSHARPELPFNYLRLDSRVRVRVREGGAPLLVLPMIQRATPESRCEVSNVEFSGKFSSKYAWIGPELLCQLTALAVGKTRYVGVPVVTGTFGRPRLLAGTKNHLYAAAENCYDVSSYDRHIYLEVVKYTHVLTRWDGDCKWGTE
jgi:hypothetical protein